MTLAKRLLDLLPEVDTKSSFRDTELVGKVLLECLIDNDPENFMNILDSFIAVNKKRVAESADIARATVHNAFSKKGNPTLKTIAKIVHEAVKSRNVKKVKAQNPKGRETSMVSGGENRILAR